MRKGFLLGCLAVLGAVVPAGLASATTFDGSCRLAGVFRSSPGFSWNPKPQSYIFDISGGTCTGSLNGGPGATYSVFDSPTFNSLERGTAIAGCSPGGTWDADTPGTGVIFLDLNRSLAGPEEDLNLSTGPGTTVTPDVVRKVSGTAGGTAGEVDQFNPAFNDLIGCTSGIASGGGVTSIPYTAQINTINGALAD